MKKKSITPFLPVLLFVILTLACGSVQVGVVTPTFESEPFSIEDAQESTPEVVGDTIEISAPTEEPTAEPPEDFSHLWVEYWNPVFDYGLAIPSHWRVETEIHQAFGDIQRMHIGDFWPAAFKHKLVHTNPVIC